MTDGKKIEKKMPKGAIERIGELERAQNSLVQAINQGLTEFHARLNSQAEVIEAIVSKFGVEEIQKVVDENRASRAAERAEKARADLEQAVANGDMALAETISETSYLVGVETDPDGNAIPPGRVQLPFGNVIPALKESLLGQPAGTRVETPGKTTFEVLEIYEPVEKAKAEEAAAPEAPKEEVAPEKTEG